jgi:tetratricopeptide (TPR) repeat protein
MGRTDEALQQFLWAIDHSPVPSAQLNSNASQTLMILGRFDETKKMLDAWRQKGSFTPFQTMLRYRLAFIENDAATLERLASTAAPDDPTWIRIQMNIAFLRGDLGKLHSLHEAAVDQQKRANRMENAATELAYYGDEEAYLGNYAHVRELCRQAEELGNNSALGLMKCSRALGAAGDMTQAEALVAKLDRLFPEDTLQQKLLLPVIRSNIERKRSNFAKAVDLLVPVTQYPNVVVFYNRGEAYLAAGHYPQAASDFASVIGHRGWPEWEVFAPLAELGLAQAYARNGERENGRKAYDVFFATWKDADSNIPILRQAQSDYTKLKATAAVASARTKQQ